MGLYDSIFKAEVCSSCQGGGCQKCQNFGYIGYWKDKEIVFSMPDYVNLEARKRMQTYIWIYRVLVLVLALFTIIYIFNKFLL